MFWTKSTPLQTFHFQVARLRHYVAITCCTLLHQVARVEGKNSFRERRDILLSERDPQRFFFIMLLQFQSKMCYPPAGDIIFSLTKLIFYGGRGGIWEPGAGSWGQIIQTPIWRNSRTYSLWLLFSKILY